MKVGTQAPDFELQDGDGNTVHVSSFRGRKLVLYFYPKDMTPGCTTEACDFRDLHARFLKADIAVVGVSPDTIDRHQKFTAKYELNFPLLSDPDHQVAELYDVWQEKKLYGKTFMGIVRTTILIDERGRIEKVWRKVKVKHHAREVLAAATGRAVSARLPASTAKKKTAKKKTAKKKTAKKKAAKKKR